MKIKTLWGDKAHANKQNGYRVDYHRSETTPGCIEYAVYDPNGDETCNGVFVGTEKAFSKAYQHLPKRLNGQYGDKGWSWRKTNDQKKTPGVLLKTI